jgi:hypothetical protein
MEEVDERGEKGRGVNPKTTTHLYPGRVARYRDQSWSPSSPSEKVTRRKFLCKFWRVGFYFRSLRIEFHEIEVN